MPSPAIRLGIVCAALLGAAAPVEGQVLIRGRVEDAEARTPIAGARVMGSDSTAVFTDSLGAFSLSMNERPTLYVEVTQYGYIFQRFYLPAEAPSRRSVLLLEPNVIELEAIDVVAESSVTRLLESLRSRRNAYFGTVQAFDRQRLDEIMFVGSVWDFVESRTWGLWECSPFEGPSAFSPGSFGNGRLSLFEMGRRRSGLCNVSGGGILVCIDGWDSWAAVSELSSMDIRSVALVEIYGRRGRDSIRVYSSRYLLSMASKGRTLFFPLATGC